MKIKTLISVVVITIFPHLCFAELIVASLNPVITFLARQIGGEHVKIIELMRAGDNPQIY